MVQKEWGRWGRLGEGSGGVGKFGVWGRGKRGTGAWFCCGHAKAGGLIFACTRGGFCTPDRAIRAIAKAIQKQRFPSCETALHCTFDKQSTKTRITCDRLCCACSVTQSANCAAIRALHMEWSAKEEIANELGFTPRGIAKKTSNPLEQGRRSATGAWIDRLRNRRTQETETPRQRRNHAPFSSRMTPVRLGSSLAT